ncbi:glutathione S-transferase C-terminal domain-containing protein [Streptomyces bungoensis]
MRGTGAETDEARPATLCLPAHAADIDAFHALLERAVTPAAEPSKRSSALDLLDHRPAGPPYALGDDLTAADVNLWVALVHLDPGDALNARPRLRDYVRRLGDHPAFRDSEKTVSDAA